ncbi:unnamed protein product [Allacma fusca]|uniref:Uncharacterized protein n=1 Tax=Allacma fusca TaxID=39272 RepID=A0A8J2LU99_9HEXA|nr:unnamed protein product [Allacma fusca]
MKLTTVVITLIFACSAHAFSVSRGSGNHVAPLQDFGPTVKEALDSILASLAEGDPIPIDLIPELRLNLTELIGAIIGENATSPIKGEMVITAPAIGLKPGGVCERASVILNSIVRPVDLDVLVSLPGAGIVGDYSINALLLGIIPVRGEGRFYLGVDLSAGVTDTSLKLKLGSANGTLTSFEYLFDLRSLDINLEGLIGGPDLSDKINEILNDFIDKEITPALISLEATLHPVLRAILHDTLNEVVKPITYQMLLDLLNPKP